MSSYNLSNVSSYDRRWVNYRVSKGFSPFTLRLSYPDCRKVKGRLKGRNTCDFLLYISRVHRHVVVKEYLSFTYRHTLYLDYILVRIKLDIISKPYYRYYAA